MLLHENQDPKGGLLRGNSQRRSLGTRGSQMGRHLETEDLLFNVVQVSPSYPPGFPDRVKLGRTSLCFLSVDEVQASREAASSMLTLRRGPAPQTHIERNIIRSILRCNFLVAGEIKEKRGSSPPASSPGRPAPTLYMSKGTDAQGKLCEGQGRGGPSPPLFSWVSAPTLHLPAPGRWLRVQGMPYQSDHLGSL